jgi:hypothetical protein
MSHLTKKDFCFTKDISSIFTVIFPFSTKLSAYRMFHLTKKDFCFNKDISSIVTVIFPFSTKLSAYKMFHLSVKTEVFSRELDYHSHLSIGIALTPSTCFGLIMNVMIICVFI